MSAVEKILAIKKNHSYDPLGTLVDKVSQLTATRTFSDEKITKIAISSESLDSSSEQTLISTFNNIEATLRSAVEDSNYAIEEFQAQSAGLAALFAADPKAFLATPLRPLQSGTTVHQPYLSDGYPVRQGISLEAYDERDNRNAQLFSIVYNLLSSRQDDFGETLFPTIVVNPTEVGITISMRLYYVYNDFKRSVTGALADYGRRNVIRAYADWEILRNELTRAVPVLRNVSGSSDYNGDKFLTAVPSWTEYVGNGVAINTAPLKTGVKVDLIALSQTQELLNSGIMGPSDTLDTYIKLSKVYIKVSDGTDTAYFAVSTDDIPGTTFTFSPQNNYRLMILFLDTTSIVIDKYTPFTGTLPSALATVINSTTNPYTVRISLNLSGSVVLDKGDTIINNGTVGLVIVRDSEGHIVNDATLLGDLNTMFSSAETVGYTLTAYRANSNIRQRGQLLDNQVENKIISIPYRSPISVIMPAINSGDDNAAIQNLITATGVRISNEAVTRLLKAETSLKSYNPVANLNGDYPELDAIGYFYVKPVYMPEEIDLSATVDSLKSHERIKDIRAALVEKIRYHANELYRRSEYKAAATVLTGNTMFKPTVIVATDLVLYNYIMADGDLRTLGDTFDVKVVCSMDHRIDGRIFITFGVFDSARNTAVNPLNFGNLLWSPELTVVMPVSRDGQVSKELIVSPRFAHIVNLPVLSALTVTNLPTAVDKINVLTKQVP